MESIEIQRNPLEYIGIHCNPFIIVTLWGVFLGAQMSPDQPRLARLPIRSFTAAEFREPRSLRSRGSLHPAAAHSLRRANLQKHTKPYKTYKPYKNLQNIQNTQNIQNIQNIQTHTKTYNTYKTYKTYENIQNIQKHIKT